MYLVATYKLSLISVILCCDGPIALCSTVITYLHWTMPSPHCIMYVKSNEGVIMMSETGPWNYVPANEQHLVIIL